MVELIFSNTFYWGTVNESASNQVSCEINVQAHAWCVFVKRGMNLNFFIAWIQTVVISYSINNVFHRAWSDSFVIMLLSPIWLCERSTFVCCPAVSNENSRCFERHFRRFNALHEWNSRTWKLKPFVFIQTGPNPCCKLLAFSLFMTNITKNTLLVFWHLCRWFVGGSAVEMCQLNARGQWFNLCFLLSGQMLVAWP